ncbi:GIP [Symbiodinium sp. KB8]|nr:GIP [Symbiodinium sp. KB8]
MFAPIGWPFRTTIMQRNGTWFLLEHCVPWYDIVNVEALLPGEQVAEVVTFLHVRKEPVSEIGVQLPAGMAEPEGLPEPKFYSFVRESDHAPVGTIELDREVPEDEAMAGFEDSAGQWSPDKPVQVPLPDQVESGVPTGDAEPLTLDGVLIDQDSSLTVLKAAAAKLNLSTAGSRSRLYARVRSYVEKQKLALELELAGDAQGLSERPPRVQPAPREPTDAERLLHECTHLPFAPWCDHCIAMRAVPDRSEHLVQGPRDVPVVQFDFCFTGYSLQDGMHGLDEMPDEAQRALKCLVAHDSATGSIAAIPCEAKGDTRYLGIELMRFIQGDWQTLFLIKHAIARAFRYPRIGLSGI